MNAFLATFHTIAQDSAYQTGRIVGQIIGILLLIAIVAAVIKKMRGK